MTNHPNRNKKYAIRLGFGSEGHGEPIFVASGVSTEEAEENAKSALQAEFGGLWVSKIRDTYVGSLRFLERTFPHQPGTKTVRDVISELD